jgi:acetyl-CoA carboxylase carboxyltransferase component
MTHNTKSGVAHFAAENEEHCLGLARQLLSYIPQNNLEDPPFAPTADPEDRMDEELTSIIPDSPNKPYDMKDIIRRVVDDGQLFEVHEHWAQNIVVGFARFGGFSTGVIANQPAMLAGALDIDASTKAARFVRFCDAFNIPLVTFVDVPGFLPGLDQEHGGIIRNGAKLIWAYCEATVPKVTVITRKAYGGAYVVMSSKHLRGDINYTWPTAEIAVMGPEGAVNVVFRKEISGMQTHRRNTGTSRCETTSKTGESAMEQKHNIAEISSQLMEPFKVVLLEQVDDYCVFLTRIEGTYLFHQHARDEMYLVLEGEIAMDYPDGNSVTLKQGDSLVARSGEKHRSRSKEGAVVLIFKHKSALLGMSRLDRIKEALRSNLPLKR